MFASTESAFDDDTLQSLPEFTSAAVQNEVIEDEESYGCGDLGRSEHIPDSGGTANRVEEYESDAERNVCESLKTITVAMKSENEKYLLPSEMIEMEDLPEKFCVAGYVLESVGTVSSSNSAQRPVIPSPSKKRKTEKTLWHAVYIGDEKAVVNIWGRYNSTSSSPRVQAVRRLSELPQKQFVAIYMYDGPFELSMSNPRFKKYLKCNNEVEAKLLKAKILATRKPLIFQSMR